MCLPVDHPLDGAMLRGGVVRHCPPDASYVGVPGLVHLTRLELHLDYLAALLSQIRVSLVIMRVER